MNTLYLGDCLNVLRDNIKDESVDLVYIDPPFNSKRDYNIFFDDKEIQTQRVAFEDTWTLKNIQDSLAELQTMQTEKIHLLLAVYQKVAPHAFPYLVMMALRIVELHRVLKLTDSFYLHCDPTVSHYLKTVCDIIFDPKNFRNEIIWKRTSAHNDPGRFGANIDIVLFYSKSVGWSWNQIYTPHDQEYLDRFRFSDPDGRKWTDDNLTAKGLSGGGYTYTYKGVKSLWRVPVETMKKLDKENRLHFTNRGGLRLKRYLDENKGFAVQALWDDIPPINSQSQERLGYPTQKPKALMERIIKASSNEGDVVLDAFCGCGTTIDAAEGLHRKWIGIDISPIAFSLIKRRLQGTYKGSMSKFEIRGTPEDFESAQRLWKENAFAFQDWWITEFEAFSTTFGTKGADEGVDGIALYTVDNKGTRARVAYQVKGGYKVQSKDMDALLGAMEKHKCDLGVFLTSTEPTKPMLDTVAGAGFVRFGDKQHHFEFPKLQVLTLKDYFAGKRPKLPAVNITFKAATHAGKKKQTQEALEL